MDLNNIWILSLLFFINCFHQSHSFSITELLNPFPDLSSFKNYIVQAQLASEIDARQTITVLAVDNGGLGSLSGEGIDVVRTVISVHVLLDYFDAAKFRSMSGSTLTPTLFQTTGKAAGQEGFVNISIGSGGSVLFGSGVEGSSPRASLVKTVVAQPYNISILQISSLIYPKGIKPPTTPPSTPPSPTTTSPPSANATSPPSANATSPPSANTTSPPPANTTSPPSPTTASPPSPGKAPSPAAGSPKSAPSKSPKTAPSPAVDGPLADAPAAADKAGSSSLRFGGSLILTLVAISTWLTMG